MPESPKNSNCLLAVLTAGPMAAYGALMAAGAMEQSPEARIVVAAMLIGASLLGSCALALRFFQWRSMQSRILHAHPTKFCRACGYSSQGLDTERVDSGTLLFEHATCPECGRPNPR